MRKEDLIILKEKISKLSKNDKILRDTYLRDLSNGTLEGPLTGYPSIDKPWLKYYSKENIGKERKKLSAYEYMKENNIGNLSSIAINYMGEKITYKELLKNIDTTAQALSTIGIKSGDVVTMIMTNIPENVYCFYALNKIGAVANIIAPRLKKEQILETIKEVNSSCLISIDTFMNQTTIEALLTTPTLKNIILVRPIKVIPSIYKFKYKKYNVLTWEDFIRQAKVEVPSISKNNEENAAVMVKTGGTTGKPKTVVLSNKNLNEMANQHILGEYNFKKSDLFLNFLPPFVAYGICGATHMPLSLGLETILIPKFDAKDFPGLMLKYKPNIVFGGPILYEKMMDSKKTKNINLSNLKVAVSGGDTMVPELEKRINEYFERNNCIHHVGQGYGMTEVSSSMCYSKENAYVEGSVGIPLINNNISIYDTKTMEEKMYGEEGEICVKTDTMMIEYLNNQEEYNNVVKKHSDGSLWVHTGDIGKMTSDGNLFVIGRIKRIIVSNGSKIFPTTIENIINKNNKVLSSSVVGGNHNKLRKVPIAHIVLKDESVCLEQLVEQLDKEIKQELPDHYVPYIYVFRKNMPLTSINKVDYKTLENENYTYESRIVVNKEESKKLIKRR